MLTLYEQPFPVVAQRQTWHPDTCPVKHEMRDRLLALWETGLLESPPPPSAVTEIGGNTSVYATNPVSPLLSLPYNAFSYL